MKGKKLVIAVILALIVCLVLIPTCAFADEAVPDAQMDGQQQTEQTYEQSNAAVTSDTPDAAVTEKDDSSDNDEDSSLSDSGDKEAADPASGDESSNVGDGEKPKVDDTKVDDTKGDDTKGEEPKGNETEESKVAEEGTSGGENVPLQPEEPKYKVEFGENKEFVLNGGESAKLSDVLGALGITGEISSAASSDDSLFSVKQDENGEWSVTAENCFSSEQRMTVVVNGQTYEIVVTDAGVVAKNITTGKDYDSLQNAINDADKNAVIQLSDNVTESVTIASGKTITIDLNGWTLTYSKANHTNTINNHGNLTIRDSVGTGKVDNTVIQGAPIYNSPNGNLTIESGTITRSKEQGINKDGYAGINGNSFYTIQNEGTMTIKGGKVDNKGSYSSNVANGSQTPNAMLTIEGGEFVSGKATVNNKANSTVIINGGTFTNENGIEDGGVVKNRGSMTINGGTFNGKVNIGGQPYETIINSGVYTDENVTKFVDKGNVAILTANGKTAIVGGDEDESIKIIIDEAMKSGEPLVIENLPLDSSVSAPEGLTIVNNSKKTLTVNGVAVTPGMNYTVPAAPPAAPLSAKYFVIEGKNAEWTKGSNADLKFVLNSKDVVKVLIDGAEVEFTVAEDGTVTIAATVIEALEAGTHEIEFIFADGSCKTTFTVK